MARALVAAVAALTIFTTRAATVKIAFEPPYSLALAGQQDDLETCGRVSGFDFRNTSHPTVPQLSRMCDNPGCGAILSTLMINAQANVADKEIAMSTTTAFAAFGYDMLNYCWFFRSPGDPCPTSPFVEVATHLAEVDTVCRNQSNYSFQFKDDSQELHGFVPISRAVWATRKLCTIPECTDILARLHFLGLLDPCVNTWESGPGAVRQSMLTQAFDAQCRSDVSYNFPKHPAYYFQPGPSMPLNLSDPVVPTETPAPTTEASLSSDGSNDIIEEEEEEDRTPTPSTKSTKPKSTLQITEESSDGASIEGEEEGQEERIQDDSSSGSSALWSASSESSTSHDGSGLVAPVVKNMKTLSPSASPKRISNAVAPTASPPAPVIANENSESSSTTTVVTVAVVAALVLFVIIGFVYRRQKQSPKPGDYVGLASPAMFDGSMDLDPVVALLALASSSSVSQKRVPVECLQDIRLIGTGGNGVVYLVRDTRGDCLLASKRLVKNQLTKDMIDAFVAEIQLVSALEHPCIVSFIGASWTNRTDMQALFEYMDGGDLRTHLEATIEQRGVWTADKLQIACDVAEALVYVHSVVTPAVVHRDIKSRNVLLSSLSRLEQDRSQRRAKLTDFGVAREQSQHESMTTGVGTSRWLAPEVIIGGGTYNAACDIYSFGVVLSELDTHRVPFSDFGSGDRDAGSTIPEITILTMVAMEGLQPTLSDQCPEDVRLLAKSCLSYDPKDRPTAQEVVTRLSAILGQATEAPRDS